MLHTLLPILAEVCFISDKEDAMTAVIADGTRIYTPRSEMIAGLRDTLPLMLGAVPFGLIFGATSVLGGLSPLAVVALSVIVFAGSSQFIGARLFINGVALPVIWLTTFMVNVRHALYSATLAPGYKHLGQRWLLPLAFFLTDETFAVVVSYESRHPDSPYRHWYQMGSSLGMYVNWVLWTVAGIVTGTSVQGLGNLGLDFAMVVTFIGIVVPLITTRAMLACAAAAAVTALLTYSLPNNLYLMAAALVGIAAGVLADNRKAHA